MTQVISLIITSTLVINIFLAVALIFLERRDPTSTWAWLLVLFFIPILGFVIYLLLGRQLRQKHLFRWEGRNKIGIEKLINYQLEAIENETFEFLKTDTEEYGDMIYLHLRNN